MSWAIIGSTVASIVASQAAPKGGPSAGGGGGGSSGAMANNPFQNMIPMLGNSNAMSGSQIQQEPRTVEQGPFVGPNMATAPSNNGMK